MVVTYDRLADATSFQRSVPVRSLVKTSCVTIASDTPGTANVTFSRTCRATALPGKLAPAVTFQVARSASLVAAATVTGPGSCRVSTPSANRLVGRLPPLSVIVDNTHVQSLAAI